VTPGAVPKGLGYTGAVPYGIPFVAAVLLVIACAHVARELRRSHPVRLVVQTALGASLGGLPAARVFEVVRHVPPEIQVRVFLFGFVLGVVLGTLGTMAGGQVLGGWRSSVLAAVGALLGAAAGTGLAFLTLAARGHDAGGRAHVLAVAALLVGAFSTLGHQLGSPRPSPRGP